MWAERTVVERWTTWCIMKVEGLKKIAVLLYATRLGHLPYRATFSLFNMRTCWGIIEDAYWLLDNATHYCSYRLVRKLRTAQYIVLAYTAFCVNSLKYYIFYLIWYTITFVIPSFYQNGSSVNRHICIFTETSRPSTNDFGGEDFASAVEIDGNRSAMNSDDFIKIDAFPFAILQTMSTYSLSLIWN